MWRQAEELPKTQAASMNYDLAACKGADTEIFFPTAGSPAHQALAYCQKCSQIAPCLAEAMTRVDECGVLGGTTEGDRRRIRYAMRKAGVRA